MFYLFVFVALIASLVIYSNKNRKKLKEEYEEALKGSNKKAALEAGRKYYSSLRGGKLTIYDEQALTNDISTMKN